MRHYGVPTRLLDWSESISVAAFFAINANQSSDSMIWFLDPGALNKRSIGALIPFLGAEEVYPLVRSAFSPSPSDGDSVAVLAPRTEPRMAAQLGNFTIHGSVTPLENIKGSDEFLARVLIPLSAYDRIRYDLSLLGIRISTLFPDLDHLAQQVADLKVFGPNQEDLEEPGN